MVDFREVILIRSYMKNLLWSVAYVDPALNGDVRLDGFPPVADEFSVVAFSYEAIDDVFPLLSCLKSFSSKSA